MCMTETWLKHDWECVVDEAADWTGCGANTREGIMSPTGESCSQGGYFYMSTKLRNAAENHWSQSLEAAARPPNTHTHTQPPSTLRLQGSKTPNRIGQRWHHRFCCCFVVRRLSLMQLVLQRLNLKFLLSPDLCFLSYDTKKNSRLLRAQNGTDSKPSFKIIKIQKTDKKQNSPCLRFNFIV